MPIELGQPSDDQATRVAATQAELLRALTRGDSARAEELQADVERMQESTLARVSFTALDPNDFENVVAAYPSEEGADGGMDWKAALPVLAALCADDEDLQDDEWWSEQLAGGSWSHGERLSLWQALYHINSTTPNPYLVKG